MTSVHTPTYRKIIKVKNDYGLEKNIFFVKKGLITQNNVGIFTFTMPKLREFLLQSLFTSYLKVFVKIDFKCQSFDICIMKLAFYPKNT